MEIVWDRYTSSETPSEVAERYKASLGTSGLEVTAREFTWRAPDPKKPQRVLVVSPVPASVPECPPPPSDAKTLVELSESYER